MIDVKELRRLLEIKSPLPRGVMVSQSTLAALIDVYEAAYDIGGCFEGAEPSPATEEPRCRNMSVDDPDLRCQRELGHEGPCRLADERAEPSPATEEPRCDCGKPISLRGGHVCEPPAPQQSAGEGYGLSHYRRTPLDQARRDRDEARAALAAVTAERETWRLAHAHEQSLRTAAEKERDRLNAWIASLQRDRDQWRESLATAEKNSEASIRDANEAREWGEEKLRLRDAAVKRAEAAEAKLKRVREYVEEVDIVERKDLRALLSDEEAPRG